MILKPYRKIHRLHTLVRGLRGEYRQEMKRWLKLVVAVVLSAHGSFAQHPRIRSAPPVSVVRQTAATNITAMAANPATITFTATDPDNPTVSGSSPGTVTFSLQGGALARTWSLTVRAASTTFTGCTTVPVSAVTATCSSATVQNVSGTIGTALCNAATTLSTGAATVAHGNEGGQRDNYTVVIGYTLNDRWSYIAATSPTCPVTLTYTLTAN